MKMSKLVPWNWFKREDEGRAMPVHVRGYGDESMPPVERIRREVDRIFDDFFRAVGGSPSGSWTSFPTWSEDGWLKPSVDIASTDKEYTISVELPGVDEKDVQVEVTGDTLRIRGEKRQEKEQSGRNYYAVERSYGSFRRALCLPEDADAEGLSATLKHGVLTVTVPRKESARTSAKRIEIKPA